VSGLFTKAELGPAQPRVLAEDLVIGRGLHSRSLEAVAPGVAAQWDAAKNGAPALTDVTGKSAKKFWFKCDAAPDHEWESALRNRVSNASGCPCCVNQKVSVTNSLASLKPAAAAAMWDHEANTRGCTTLPSAHSAPWGFTSISIAIAARRRATYALNGCQISQELSAGRRVYSVATSWCSNSSTSEPSAMPLDNRGRSHVEVEA
jgi:hypothetical protein